MARHTDLQEIAILAAVNGFSAVEVEKAGPKSLWVSG